MCIFAYSKEFLKKLVFTNPYTKVYGLGRSLIAFSTILVFLFNDFALLFDREALSVLKESEYFFSQFNFFALLGYKNLLLSKILSLTILITVIIGVVPQLTGLLHFWITFSFYHSAIALDGGDQIAVTITFLILPLTLFDNRLNHWYSKKKHLGLFNFIGNLSFLIISLQVCFIYLNTAIVKLTTIDEWKEGTALFYFLNSNYYGVNDFFKVIIDPILNSKAVFFLTWFVIISHLSLAFIFLLSRERKKTFIVLGILLHLLIALLMGLYSFSISMFGVLVLYMLPFDSLENILILKKKSYEKKHFI